MSGTNKKTFKSTTQKWFMGRGSNLPPTLQLNYYFASSIYSGFQPLGHKLCYTRCHIYTIFWDWRPLTRHKMWLNGGLKKTYFCLYDKLFQNHQLSEIKRWHCFISYIKSWKNRNNSIWNVLKCRECKKMQRMDVCV